MDFLKESNQNGFGFFVVSVLFYLFVFFLIQFFQHKKRFYLFYSLYALVNGVNLLKYIDGVFFSDFFDSLVGRNLTYWMHYPAQLTASMLFCFFIMDIMRLKREYPTIVKGILWTYAVVSPVYLSLWAVQLIGYQPYWIGYFHGFFFLPLNVVLFVVVLYMVMGRERMIKWYILSGMSALFISYVTITLFSLEKSGVEEETLYIFYLGVLIESLLFALAIGLEQKMAYKKKAIVQKKYIAQLEENQAIKESINRTLSDELIQTKTEMEGLTTEAQKERTEKLTMKMENRFAQLRLDALRGQMNPHFIFNALGSIKSYLIENNQEKAIYYLGRFSKLIRGTLESSREDLITLEKEMNTIRMYVEIESDRFKNNITYTYHVDESLKPDQVLIPSLLLQPFVENSIWHGLTTKKGDKLLKIEIKAEGPDRLRITVEDNGIGREASQKRNLHAQFKDKSLGLSILQDRLDFFSKKFKEEFKVRVIDLKEEKTGKPMGTKVVLSLPILTVGTM
ncbi:sensor histidine kinase [Pseudozobellia thermophila]|uniref:Histidine kinase-, DNA gyrase B-, and HSP90-like ATPase n=1 Tax=Pseudozobellia thermophila TaxID=192903 RepID=A0A1M6AC95_9FLAO|nr:histidine kinase [Pseudozobellia thermophila]SHI34029.1 Histidine kinase-, DNA gyrase B-, and HSP90-like ATPase [Pseudozobellia thermophila]